MSVSPSPSLRSSGWRGDVKDLSAALLPHADTPGFCVYDEDVHKGSYKKELLQKHAGLIASLRSLSPPAGVFRKRDVTCALDMVWKQQGFAMRAGDKSAWLESMSNRLRTIARHFSRAEQKFPDQQWVKDILAAASKKPSPQHCQQYLFGWEHEMSKAFRQPQPAKKGQRVHKEFSSKVEKGSNDWDPVIAHFEDGSQHPIAEMLTSDFQPTGPPKKSSSCIWQKESKNHGLIQVKFKKDHSPLACILAGKKQVCQLVCHDESKRELAGEIMTAVAVKFADGKVSQGQLKRARDELAAEKGFKKGSSSSSSSAIKKRPSSSQLGIRKKPAAAQPPASPTNPDDTVDADASSGSPSDAEPVPAKSKPAAAPAAAKRQQAPRRVGTPDFELPADISLWDAAHACSCSEPESPAD